MLKNGSKPTCSSEFTQWLLLSQVVSGVCGNVLAWGSSLAHTSLTTRKSNSLWVNSFEWVGLELWWSTGQHSLVQMAIVWPYLYIPVNKPFSYDLERLQYTSHVGRRHLNLSTHHVLGQCFKKWRKDVLKHRPTFPCASAYCMTISIHSSK